MDPQPPVAASLPGVEIQVLSSDPEVDKWAESLGRVNTDARLLLTWPRFEGRLESIEYRIFMWTLSPDQRRRALGGRNMLLVDNKSRSSGLPPIIDTLTVRSEEAIPPLDSSDCVGQPRVTAKPCGTNTLLPQGMTSNDLPRVVAYVKPFEPAPRAHAVRRNPKAPPLPSELAKHSNTISAEVHVPPLPKGHGYVFAVEAKHTTVIFGNVGEWSVPIFSKLVEFETHPRQLSFELEGRFGNILFKGNTSTAAKPTNESHQLAFQAHPVSFVDEHRELPSAMPLLPDAEPWPLKISSPSGGKYLVRAKGKIVNPEEVDTSLAVRAVEWCREQQLPPSDNLRQR
jgi:hypothetical protein